MPIRRNYEFSGKNFATTQTFKIKGPKGKGGKVHDYGVFDVTTALTATTTGAVASVGQVSDLDQFGANVNLGAVPIGGTATMRGQLTSLGRLNEFVPDSIDKDVEVILTITAPTGGTPAGAGTAFVTIDWDN